MSNHAKKRFGLTDDRITMPPIEFRYAVAGIQHNLPGAATCSLGFQASENATPIAAATLILINRHISYLGLIEGVEVQPSARQDLPRRIKEENMKRRIILGIAFAAAWLAPWL